MTSIEKAAQKNNRREMLEALRDKLAQTIDACESGRDIAALSKRLMEVAAELDALPDPKQGKNPVQLAREKAAGRAAS